MLNFLKLWTWGMISFHTFFCLLFPVLYIFPNTISRSWEFFWNLLMLLAMMFAFLLNLCVAYGLHLVFSDAKERQKEQNPIIWGVWGLCTFIFVSLIITNLSQHKLYKYAKPIPIELAQVQSKAMQSTPQLYYLKNAQILPDFSFSKKRTETTRNARTSSTYYHQKQYTITPVVPQNWQASQPIEVFLAYRSGENTLQAFELKYPVRKGKDMEFNNTYNFLLPEWKNAHALKVSTKPIFLTMVDTKKLLESAWWYAGLFYALLIGIWTVLVLALLPRT